MYYVYILRDSKNKLYVGQANDWRRRLSEHERGKIKFTYDYRNTFRAVYLGKAANQLEAMKREKQLKGWTRAKKEALIVGDPKLLKKL